MKKKFRWLSFILFILLVNQSGCSENQDPKAIYVYRDADYSAVSFSATQDTIDFPLGPKGTTKIASSNYFTQNGKSYISFYDKISRIIFIYTFPDAYLVKTVPVKKWLTGKNIDKSSVYVRNFDSIFIASMDEITIYDTSSLIRTNIKIPPSRNPKRIPKTENQTPLTIFNGRLFSNIVPYVDERSASQHKKWKLLYGFDLSTNKEELYYHFPEAYRENIFGYPFLNYGYCLNNNHRFIFSFPADTNIYETDFFGYHKAYRAKSQNQLEDITPITVEDIENGRSFQEYSLRDSYSSIYFDPYQKRYLRLVKLKMDESSLLARYRIRRKTVLLLDESFKIIGESSLPNDIDFNSIFFAADGQVYIRSVSSRVPKIRFIRFVYSDVMPAQLARK